MMTIKFHFASSPAIHPVSIPWSLPVIPIKGDLIDISLFDHLPNKDQIKADFDQGYNIVQFTAWHKYKWGETEPHIYLGDE